MKSPIDQLLDKIEYTEVPKPETTIDDLPYVTHSGILKIGGFEITVLVLSDGQKFIPIQTSDLFNIYNKG